MKREKFYFAFKKYLAMTIKLEQKKTNKLLDSNKKYKREKNRSISNFR